MRMDAQTEFHQALRAGPIERIHLPFMRYQRHERAILSDFNPRRGQTGPQQDFHMERTPVNTKNAFRLALMAGATFVAASLPALAQDADEFAAAFAAAYKPAGYDITFGSGTVKGDDITYDGVTVSVVGMGKDAEPIKFDTAFTFSGVTENDDGSYTVASLAIPDVDIDEEGTHVTVANIKMNDLFVPAEGDADMVSLVQSFGSFSAGPIAIDVAGASTVKIASISSESTFDPEQGSPDLESMAGTAKLEGLEVDLSKVPDPQAQAFISALGLETITGSMFESVNWTMKDGRMNVDEASLTMDNLGKLDFTFDISGYTPALMQAMSDAQAKVADIDPDDTEAMSKVEEELGMQMLASLAISHASFRFDDDSLTNKLLDFFASQQNISRADMVAGLQVVIPAMTADYKNLTVVKQATEAVSAFLENPKSLEISLDPGRTVPFTELMGAAQDPQSVLDLLKVSVTAND